jgi:hypothetical protein
MKWDSSHEVAASEAQDTLKNSYSRFPVQLPESDVYCTPSWPTLVQDCVERLSEDVRDGHKKERDKYGVSAWVQTAL